MSVPTTHNLYCTVCKDFYGSPVEWVNHLPEAGHQRKARLGCRRWGTSVRECVLVAFGSCPLADCDILRSLSRVSYPMNLVTDFIYWKKKPNIALFQFESRNKVDEVIERTKAEIKVGINDRVQLKRASDYLELEWNVLLSLRADNKVDEDVWDVHAPCEIEVKEESGKPTCQNNDCADVGRSTSKTGKKTRRIESTEGNCNKTESNNKRVKSKNSTPIPVTQVITNIPSSPLKNTRKTKCRDGVNGEKFEIDIPQKVKRSASSKFYLSNDEDGEICDKSEEYLQQQPSKAADSVTDDFLIEKLLPPAEKTGDEFLVSDELVITNVDTRDDVLLTCSDKTQIIENCLTEKSTTSSGAYCEEEQTENLIEPADEPVSEIITLSSDSETENNADEFFIQTNIIEVTRQEETNNKSSKQILEETLRKNYVSLFQDILIPKKSLDTAVSLIDMLKTEFKKTVPWCKIIPFRNWYLGIQTCGNNELLLFLDYRRIWESVEWKDNQPDTRKPPVISTFLNSPEQIFPDIVKFSKDFEKKMNSRDGNNRENFGAGFLHKPSGLRFRVICSLFLLHEVQTCLLAEYLCLFDLKVLPLLSMVNLWANLNSLMLANFNITNSTKTFITPAPASVEWLVFLFLTHKKLIPSVRTILERPHNKIIFRDVDIGFSNDLDFPQAWSSLSTPPLQIHEQIRRLRNTEADSDPYKVNNILGTLELVRDFFSFYGRYQNAHSKHVQIVLNPKDGDIISQYVPISKDYSSEQIVLSEEKASLLQKKDAGKNDRKVTLLHPIDAKFSLSFCGGKFSHVITPLMRMQSDKIGNYIRKFSSTRRTGRTVPIKTAGLCIRELLKVWTTSSRKKSTKRIRERIHKKGKKKIVKQGERRRRRKLVGQNQNKENN